MPRAHRPKPGTRKRGQTALREAEAAVSFCCLEAMQNVAKQCLPTGTPGVCSAGTAPRAGRPADVALQLRHEHGALAVRIEDDSDGFDPRASPQRWRPEKHSRSHRRARRRRHDHLEPRDTARPFVLGLVMFLPSPLYLLAVKDIGDSGSSSSSNVLAVLICAIGVMLFVEIPLVAMFVRSGGVVAGIKRFESWLKRTAGALRRGSPRSQGSTRSSRGSTRSPDRRSVESERVWHEFG
jgi:Sap, sulfolipid-1-addressing protein